LFMEGRFDGEDLSPVPVHDGVDVVGLEEVSVEDGADEAVGTRDLDSLKGRARTKASFLSGPGAIL
jgi:hypothetical protein